LSSARVRRGQAHTPGLGYAQGVGESQASRPSGPWQRTPSCGWTMCVDRGLHARRMRPDHQVTDRLRPL